MGHKFTILVVEDNDLVRESIRGIIEARGFRVFSADSALAAMQILAREHVDLMFTDIVMPDHDGIALAREAKHIQPNLRVMFATGYFSRATEAQPLGTLLFKPMRAHEIEAALDQVLGGSPTH